MLGGIAMKPILKLCAVIAMSFAFSSCSAGTESSKQAVLVHAPVKLPTIEETVNTLCSDEFEGRLVGSKGNEMAGEYIGEIFKTIGLDTLFEDSYYQKYYQGVSSTFGVYGKDTKLKIINNVVGIIKGKEGKKAVVISAHFDHIGYQDGKLVRGALDNASGVAALLQVAHTLKERSKEKPFETDIIICAFNGEETAASGSRAFINAILPYVYENYNMYNINIDSIGSKNAGKLDLKNKSNISNKLYEAVKAAMKKDNIEFGTIGVRGTGDHMNFENQHIPNVFIVQEGIEDLVHRPTDTPDTLDYEQIGKIANVISDFVESNDGNMFTGD